MTDRFTAAVRGRPHDLPPMWDGVPVEWGEWQREAVFVCADLDTEDTTRTITQPPCPGCGSIQPRMTCTGSTPSRRPRFRTAGGIRIAVPAPDHLTAERCTACGWDQVIHGEQVWDLEPDDYTDRGSYA